MAIGRCVTAASGKATASVCACSSGGSQNGNGSKWWAMRSRKCAGGWRRGWAVLAAVSSSARPLAARRNFCSTSE
ncbi:hypothetical protein GALL_493520 [mine drainage metagenome]|uniref:Uncharacterized protein n=1 Tax=mine drainage metagenome TaxID=410659 RepID=A0A1J5PCU5_9ZZZZ